jgi:acyl-CoA synthetase (AMP-forming)/AMP-acid ligase II
MSDRSSSAHLSEDEALGVLARVLRWRAEREPDEVAYRFVSYSRRGAVESETVTYRQLDMWARAVAVSLRETCGGVSGDRVMLMLPTGLEYVASLFGCLYAGLIAVTAYPLGAVNSSRLDEIAHDADPCIALVGQDEELPKADVPQLAGNVLARARWLVSSRALVDGRENSWSLPSASAETPAVLQYTSGSTSAPKGVIVQHENLMANARAAERTYGMSTETVSVTWLPLYHDMGLMGIVGPMVVGYPSILMSATSFVRDPTRWLEAISKFRGTISGGPNFAYKMCVDRVTDDIRGRLDLSSWTVAINGSEPVRAEVLNRFADTFGCCGFARSAFYPSYGLAENTLLVSAGRLQEDATVRYVSRADLEEGWLRPPADPAGMQALVGSGRIAEGIDVAVVDPETRKVLPETQVGEIWIRGASVAAGYFRAAEPTRVTFEAYTDDGNGPYLRTGDLGAFIGKELVLTGRLSDLIIIRGRNIYPQDIEATCLESHPLLATTRAAAFPLDIQGEEHLVIIQELPRGRTSQEQRQEMITAIQDRVAVEHLLQPYEIVLIPARKIPLTSSGKVRRQACRAQYVENSLVRMGSSKELPEVGTAMDGHDPHRDRDVVPAPSNVPLAGVQEDAAPPSRRLPAPQTERRLIELVPHSTGRGMADVSPDEPFTYWSHS